MKTITKHYCGLCDHDFYLDDTNSAICPYCGGDMDVQEDEWYVCTICDGEYCSEHQAAECERDCYAEFRYQEMKDDRLTEGRAGEC